MHMPAGEVGKRDGSRCLGVGQARCGAPRPTASLRASPKLGATCECECECKCGAEAEWLSEAASLLGESKDMPDSLFLDRRH